MIMKYLSYLLMLFGLLQTGFVAAEVVFDGSLGPALSLPGPDFAVEASLGQQQGGNLFHSFERFNLFAGEIATFSGPDSVNNVISRVTGGQASMINGTFRSTIPGADVYFLNPAGILFGEQAKLDVLGSFHASTADTLRLGTDGQFNASDPDQSILTVAPPSAFGFLTDTPGSIRIEGSRLSTTPGKDLSLIGGEIWIKGGGVQVDEIGKPIVDGLGSLSYLTQVAAPGGQLSLISVASWGDILPSHPGFHFTEGIIGGVINVDTAQISTSGIGSGGIYVRGGRFDLINGKIESNTLGDQDGRGIDIEVEHFKLQDFAPFLTAVYANTFGSGNAGAIRLQVKKLTLSKNTIITSSSFSTGNAGNIHIDASDQLDSKGGDIGSFSLQTATGNTGHVKVITRQITLNEAAQISSTTFGIGNAGTVVIKAETITLSGKDEVAGLATGIFASSTGQEAEAGDAGRIEIEAEQLFVLGGARVTTGTTGPGKAGTIDVRVSGSLTVAGEGAVDQAGQSKSAITSLSASTEENAGAAGNLLIQAGRIHIKEGGEISTAAAIAGGGDVVISSPFLFHLKEGQLTTSVGAGAGNGGNITVSAPKFIVMNQGKIIAQAYAGDGGNITLVSQKFVQTPDSIVSASSELGQDGTVIITAPREDLGGKILGLTLRAFETPKFADFICSAEYMRNPSKFYIYFLAGRPWDPDDFQGNNLVHFSAFDENNQSIVASSPPEITLSPDAVAEVQLPALQVVCARF
jgi:filamentous hemagglutinin family protein